jgi:sterol desaturase/sphingolipid hydroxylase (fatty acid hydroxylase superfamily)
MIGVPGQVFVTVAGVNLVYQFWVHTKHIGHLGFFEKIFVTPMNHGIHHAKNKEYIDANYGGVFILWDRIFGTYMDLDREKIIYGVDVFPDENKNSKIGELLKQPFQEYQRPTKSREI